MDTGWREEDASNKKIEPRSDSIGTEKALVADFAAVGRDAAVPHLQRALAEKAAVDLKPFAGNARKKIAAVIADLQRNDEGTRVSAEISSLRLADIAFDSKTLRVIAEAEGTISVNISALPGL